MGRLVPVAVGASPSKDVRGDFLAAARLGRGGLNPEARPVGGLADFLAEEAVDEADKEPAGDSAPGLNFLAEEEAVEDKKPAGEAAFRFACVEDLALDFAGDGEAEALDFARDDEAEPEPNTPR